MNTQLCAQLVSYCSLVLKTSSVWSSRGLESVETHGPPSFAAGWSQLCGTQEPGMLFPGHVLYSYMEMCCIRNKFTQSTCIDPLILTTSFWSLLKCHYVREAFLIVLRSHPIPHPSLPVTLLFVFLFALSHPVLTDAPQGRRLWLRAVCSAPRTAPGTFYVLSKRFWVKSNASGAGEN